MITAFVTLRVLVPVNKDQEVQLIFVLYGLLYTSNYTVHM